MNNPLEQFQGLLGVETRTMSKVETNTLLPLLLSEAEYIGEEVPATHQKLGDKLEYDVLWCILLGRLSVPCSFFLKVWVRLLSDRPGTVVLWAYTLTRLHQKYATQLAGNPLTLGHWCEEFPVGLPADCGYETAWKAQKHRIVGEMSDNALDMFPWPGAITATASAACPPCPPDEATAPTPPTEDKTP